MRFEILGPLRAVDGEQEFQLSASKEELLLATLLIRANHVVTADQLQTELWNEAPPQRAAAGVYVYIYQLRKFLKRPGNSTSRIVTRTPGYLLQLRSDELDSVLFQDAVRRGRLHLRSYRPREAVEEFESALAHLRGAALGGLCGGPIVGGFAAWVEESRLECLEMLFEAYIMLRRDRESIGMLYSLIAEHPLREAFYRLLMLALYRTDRQADALRVYQEARAVLSEELGVQPCRALRELHQAILSEDDTLHSPAPLRGGGERREVRPAATPLPL